MIRKFLFIAALAFGGIAVPAEAQTINSTVAVCSPTNPALCLQPAGDANGSFVQGPVADDAVAAGNPVPVGGIYNFTPPVYSTGDRVQLQTNINGQVIVSAAGSLNTDDQANATAIRDLFGTTRPLAVALWQSDGANWDRSYTCNQSAVINVTAAATTQIVALAASQTIRICSIALSMSAAGTAQIVTGTGTNCATGLTALTGAMPLATGTPLELSASAGSSVLRSAISSAICVAAVTGNVVGFMSYAQF